MVEERAVVALPAGSMRHLEPLPGHEVQEVRHQEVPPGRGGRGRRAAGRAQHRPLHEDAMLSSPLCVGDLGVLSQVSVTHWRIAGFLATSAQVLQLIKGVAYEFNLTVWDDRMFARDHASREESSSH